MQIEFSHLGKIVDLYEGKGIMILGDQFETECNYKIAQFVDGEIRAYIETSTNC